MVRASSMYLTLSDAQQRLVADVIARAVRLILLHGPSIDNAMRDAEARYRRGDAALPPTLRMTTTVDVIEYDRDGHAVPPTLSVEGGDA